MKKSIKIMHAQNTIISTIVQLRYFISNNTDTNVPITLKGYRLP